MKYPIIAALALSGSLPALGSVDLADVSDGVCRVIVKETPALVPMDANFVDQPAHLIYQAVPEYPRELRVRGIMGYARVEVVVDTIGRVQKTKVLVADHPAFAEAATRAAMDWMFEPAMMDSKPVAVKVTIPFRFIIPSLLARR